MASWLVFLKNASAEFVLPVMAPTREAALKAANSAYSAREYTTLTCYAEDELQQILSDAQGWSAGHRTMQRETADQVMAAITLPEADPVVSLAQSKAAAAMARIQRKREEQMFGQPMLPEAPQAATPPSEFAMTALTSIRKQQADKARQQVAAIPVVEPHVGAAPVEEMRPPVPQDLKTMLALLRATASATPSASLCAELGGRVEESQGTPLPAPTVATVQETAPVVSTAISRRPQATEIGMAPPQRNVMDVFKGLRK